MGRFVTAAKLNQFLPINLSNLIANLEREQLKRGDQDFIKVLQIITLISIALELQLFIGMV